MKKLLIVFLLVFGLSGCGNKNYFDIDYQFNGVYINNGNEWKYFDIKTWVDYESSDQVQFTLKDGNVILTHANNVIMVKNQTKQLDEFLNIDTTNDIPKHSVSNQ